MKLKLEISPDLAALNRAGFVGGSNS